MLFSNKYSKVSHFILEQGESSFIITSAEKQGDKLALNVQYLTNPNENITPISINSEPAMKSDLSEFLSGTDQAAVTILVDCISGLDGRC